MNIHMIMQKVVRAINQGLCLHIKVDTISRNVLVKNKGMAKPSRSNINIKKVKLIGRLKYINSLIFCKYTVISQEVVVVHVLVTV